MGKIHALSVLCFALLTAPPAHADVTTRPLLSPAPRAGADWRLIAGLTGFGVGAVSMGIAIASIVKVHEVQGDLDPFRRGRPASVNVCDDTTRLVGVDMSTRSKIRDLCTRGHAALSLEEIFLPVSLLSITAGVVFLATRPSSPRAPTLRFTVVPTVSARRAGIDLAIQF